MSHELQSHEDVEQILRIAMDRSSSVNSPSSSEAPLHDQLNAIGRELGLRPEEIEAARTVWKQEKEVRQLAQYTKVRLFYYRAHLAAFFVILAFLGPLAWFGYLDQTLTSILLCLGGVGLFFHRHNALNPQSEGFQKDLRHWREREQGERSLPRRSV